MMTEEIKALIESAKEGFRLGRRDILRLAEEETLSYQPAYVVSNSELLLETLERLFSKRKTEYLPFHVTVLVKNSLAAIASQIQSVPDGNWGGASGFL